MLFEIRASVLEKLCYIAFIEGVSEKKALEIAIEEYSLILQKEFGKKE